MAKFNPVALASSYAAVDSLNSNFQQIAELFEKCVFRDGTSPNQMTTPINMNHFKVQNVGEPENAADAVRLIDLQNLAIGAGVGVANETASITWLPFTGLTPLNLQTALRLALPLMPEFFGALGDGSENDHNAFVEMAARVQANGGGRIKFKYGATYRVGKQVPGGTFDGSPAYNYAPEAPIFLHDIDFVDIDFNGATLKTNDGLYFGAFSPGTTTPYHTPLAEPNVFSDYTYRADPGPMIYLKDIKKAKIHGHGIMDGNLADAVIGGRYGDVGWQIQHIGIYTQRVLDLIIANMEVKNYGLDGISLSQTGLTTSDAPRPCLLDGVNSHTNGRMSMSIVGGNQIIARNCSFRDAGGVNNTDYGIVGSNPKSCIDVEAEDSVCRNISFYDTQFIANAYSANCFVTDTGDSRNITFENCLFEGPVWVNKPDIVLRRCTIKGYLAKSYPGTLYERCILSDAPIYAPLPTASSQFHDGTGSPGVIFDGCDFTQTRTMLNLRSTKVVNSTIHWQAGTGFFANLAEIIYTNSSTWFENSDILDEITVNIPAAGYVFQNPDACYINNARTTSGGKIYWASTVSGAGGYTGRFGVAVLTGLAGATVTAHSVYTHNIALAGMSTGDLLTARYSVDLGGLLLSAAIPSTNAGKGLFYNPTGSDINIPAGSVTYELKKLRPPIA